jgi:hypothetical protein
MYEVRSHYSFWGEPERYYKKCFSSVWRAYDYLLSQDDFDTSHELLRVRGMKEEKVSLMFLHRNYERHYT